MGASERLLANYQILAFVLVSTFFLSGCSSLDFPSRSGTAQFISSTEDIENRAPAQVAPPGELIDGRVLIDPSHMQTQADYHYLLAEAYKMDGKTDKTVDQLRMALVYDPKSYIIRCRLAREYAKLGLMDQAVREAQEAIILKPKETQARMLMGSLLSSIRLYDKAIVEYREVLRLQPQNIEAPIFLGALFAEKKQYKKAITYFRSLVFNKNYKTPAMAWYYVGRVYREVGGKASRRRAQSSFEKALSIDPSHVESVLALGEMYRSVGARDRALKLYRSYQNRHDSHPSVAEKLANIYTENGQLDLAYEQHEIVETSGRSSLNTQIKMALILVEKKSYAEAAKRLEIILAKVPSSDKVRFYLGAVYEEIKKYDSAIKHFLKIPQESKYYDEAIVHAAYLYKLRGNYEAAIETIKLGLKSTRENPHFFILYASFLDDLKKYDEALVLLGEAVKRFPTNAQLMFFYGSIWDRKKELHQTISSMEKALVIDANHVQAMNHLAYVYAENDLQLDRAEQLARRARELKPNDGYILDTLGWVLYKRGRVKEALKVLEMAYQLQSDEGIIAEHLGDVYYQMSMPERAVFMYQSAVQLEKDPQKVVGLQKKIHRVRTQMEMGLRRVPASKK